MDKLTAEKRSWNMSRIKGKDTALELLVRRYLYFKGIRYRINVKEPGRPDIAIKKIHTAVFINGCFWHGHENCKESGLPKSNSGFWKSKIEANKIRDKKNEGLLKNKGWDVITVWECDLEKETTATLDNLATTLSSRLNRVNRNRETPNKVH